MEYSFTAKGGAAAAMLGIILLIFPGCRSEHSPVMNESGVSAHNRGIALMGQFDFHEAEKIFRDLSGEYPDNLEVKTNLAIATLNRQEEGDEERALAILEGLLQRNPGNLRARYTSGLLELHLGRVDKALEYLRMVTEADRKDPDAWYFTGKCLLQLFRYEEALAAFRLAREADPHLQSAVYGSIMALRKLDRSGEAMEMIEEFENLRKNPRSRKLEFKYLRMGRKAKVSAIGAPPASLDEKPAGPVFEAPRPLTVDGEAVAWSGERENLPLRPGITVCDLNGDGRSDLFIGRAVDKAEDAAGSRNAVLTARSGDTGFFFERNHPLSEVTEVNAALCGDVDNDGLTDVYLCRQGPNQLWRQIAAGQWRDVSEETRSANGVFDTVDGAFFDADHDGDLDLFLVNRDGPNELLNNNFDGTFRPLAATSGLTGSGSSISLVTTDIDGDLDVDIVVINEEPPHEVYRNDLLWKYEQSAEFDTFITADIEAAVAGDLDGDGRIEFYSLPSDGLLTHWERNAGGVWERSELGSGESELPPLPDAADRLALADIDGDGSLEVVASGRAGWWAASPGDGDVKGLVHLRQGEETVPAAWAMMTTLRGPQAVTWSPGGPPFVRPPGSGRYPFLVLTPAGLEDADGAMRSNASGIGTRIAVRVGSRWTVVDTFRSDSGPGQSLQPLSIGLGGRNRADFVAIDWSDGVYQTELDLDQGVVHRIAENQRQLSSCPVLFAWDGETYTFVSDLLGVGGIGYNLGHGEYADPRPWEKFMLPQGLLRPRKNRLVLKLAEPMEEVTYLDAVRLAAYDLPPGWSMTLDERMGTGNPLPTGKPIFYRSLVLPEKAVNDRMSDVTGQITKIDREPAPVGDLDRRFIGRLRDNHVLTLTFPEKLDIPNGSPVLLADGWVEYPYSQTNFAAWQADAPFRPPTIEARGEDGEWQAVLKEFGYPAGMPRQMSVPLPDLPKGTRELRITSNLEIYWDRLALVYAEDCPDAARRELPLKTAQLEQVGFPRRIDGENRLPLYDFNHRLPHWDTRSPEGFYTRFGPVEELVANRDGMVAIFGPGEGVHLEFEEPADPVPPGWSRVNVIETDGWCKDMDRFTRDGETVTPLPSIPADPILQARFNTRYVSGDP